MISVKLALPLGRGTTPSPKSSLQPLLTIDQLQGLLLGSGDLLLPPG